MAKRMRLLPTLTALTAATACALLAALAAPPAEPRAQTADPFDGIELFVDREAPAWQEWQRLRRAGKQRQAKLVWRIAREPKCR